METHPLYLLARLIVRHKTGVLHDIKATEKSIAAGGRDSIRDEETDVSDPYADQHKAISAADLKAKVAKLQELVLKTKLPGLFLSLFLLASSSSRHLHKSDKLVPVLKLKAYRVRDLCHRLHPEARYDPAAPRVF